MQRTGLKKQRIDWQAVHRRLEANERGLEQALTPTYQRIEDAYRKRAVQLAQADKKELPVSPGLPVLLFRLGQERYAIELKHLAEVLPFGDYAPIPRSPTQFLGAISLRGELRAVVDLRCLLKISGETANDPGFVLMLRPGTGNEQIGLKVDSIEQLREIRPEELTGPAQGSFATGLVAGSVTLLSVESVLENIFSNTGSNARSNTGSNEESLTE